MYPFRKNVYLHNYVKTHNLSVPGKSVSVIISPLIDDFCEVLIDSDAGKFRILKMDESGSDVKILSPNDAVSIVANLLDKTNCSEIYVSLVGEQKLLIETARKALGVELSKNEKVSISASIRSSHKRFIR